MKLKRSAIPAFVSLWSAQAWAGTCSLCREALQEGGSAGLIKGIYWSILFILVVPLVVIALGVRYASKHYS